ncbi:unnamed protein product [Absidia cylindrospora]
MSLIIEPSNLLTFKRPLTGVTKETLLVKNPNAEPVIFKVKTTAPKQYCVRPNAGRINGNGQVEVQVILQPFKAEPPLDFKCKDKFLVQSAQIQPHEYDSIPVTDIWTRIEKQDQGSIRQHKIKCSFGATPTQENNTATQSHIPPPPYALDNNTTPNDAGSSHETNSSNNDTIGSAPLSEEEKAAATVDHHPVTETVKEQQQDVLESTIVSNVEQQQQQPQQPQQPPTSDPQVDEKPQTPIPVTATPATTQTIREASSLSAVDNHQPPVVTVKTPSKVEAKDEKEPSIAEPLTTTKDNETSSDSDEKQQLRQDLVAAQQQIVRLQHELEQSKQDLDGLRLRQNATAATPAGTTRKLPPTVQPLDAVHQHLAQLQKPHPIEGYPPKVVLIMCGVVFLFTYLFL